jgi:Protein of unknown function (DUF3500)
MGHDHGRGAPSRRDFLGTTAAAGACLPLSALAFSAVPELAQAMAQVAQAWLGSLAPQDVARARLAWTDAGRNAWHYVPRSRPGVALREMTSAQAAAAWDLIATLLSARGLEQARGQLLLERALGELTRNERFRDPGNYALVLFGDPAGRAPWCWRFEGHHLSLTTVVAPGHGLAVTPVFFGANPAKIPARHAHAGFRLLGAEEDQAFALIRSLDAGARAKAVIAERSLGDIVAGPGRELSLARFEGIAVSQLSEPQRDGVLRILELYAGTLREEIARPASRGCTLRGPAVRSEVDRTTFGCMDQPCSSNTTTPRTAPTTCIPCGLILTACSGVISSGPTTRGRTERP